ncbi:MAG TPA: hypothetical protein VIW24_17470 [Aldersonia sp.]
MLGYGAPDHAARVSYAPRALQRAQADGARAAWRGGVARGAATRRRQPLLRALVAAQIAGASWPW